MIWLGPLSAQDGHSTKQGTLFEFGGLTGRGLLVQDEQRELAKTIRVSGSILLSTVSNFLDFFKMEAGKALDIVRTEVDVQVCTGTCFIQHAISMCLLISPVHFSEYHILACPVPSAPRTLSLLKCWGPMSGGDGGQGRWWQAYV